MAGVLDKIRKRLNYPVVLPNEETVIIRMMTIGEHIRMANLANEQKIGFRIGSVLLADDGSNKWTKLDNETDSDFSNRAALECDLDLPAMHAINAAIQKLEKMPSIEVVVKNSPETSTQD